MDKIEQKIKQQNMSFIQLLVEKEIKGYKYNICEESLVSYVNKSQNIKLLKEIKKYNLTDNDLYEIEDKILNTAKYNLEVEYLPTEDWEFEIEKPDQVAIAIPSYDMLSDGLALLILVFPFAALFLSYFIIMIFR